MPLGNTNATESAQLCEDQVVSGAAAELPPSRTTLVVRHLRHEQLCHCKVDVEWKHQQLVSST